MELKPQFEAFLKDIRPTDRQREDWRTGSETLRSRLLNDKTLSPLIVGTFLQGSVRRSTAVRPTGDKRPDVDVVIVTTIDYQRETPAEAMKRFVPFLDQYYKGKWKPQDRSFAIELSYVDLDLVVTSLPTDPNARSKLQEIYKSEAVQTLDSLEEHNDWQLNKNWTARGDALKKAVLTEAVDQDWKKHPLMLPDRQVSNWGPTHPVAQIQWSADKNRKCNGHYVNVVRTLKWWRHEHSSKLPKYPKGYPLEHMIGFVSPDDTQSMAKGITHALEGIRDSFANHAKAGNVPFLADHGVPSHNVLKRVSAKDFRDFHEGASSAAKLARKALDSQDAEESGELWRELLGSSFPLPGPKGGDRSRGFTAPSSPASPGNQRFA